MTVPTIKGEDSKAVQQWMHDLMKADLLWHMDDSVENVFVVQDDGLTEEDIKLLREGQNKAWSICNREGTDIHEFSLAALGM